MVTMTDKPAGSSKAIFRTEAQSSLPLFGDPMAAGVPGAAHTSEQVRVQVPTGDVHSVNAHLLEARRLARRMRRLRNQKEEQTRTGQAICHHLKAMLTESRPHA